VSVRPDRGAFEPVRVAHPVTSHIEPRTPEARPVRTREHRIKHNTRMLDRPPRPVGAVNVLILAAQFFALIPQPPGNVHAARLDLPGDHGPHSVGRASKYGPHVLASDNGAGRERVVLRGRAAVSVIAHPRLASALEALLPDGDPVTVSFDRVDAGRVVHGLPVRDVRSRAGQRKVLGPLADPVVALPMNGLVHSTLDTPSTGTHAFTDSHVHQSCGRRREHATGATADGRTAW
jgi:hypothetical protein